jgi:hypothetical protein
VTIATRITRRILGALTAEEKARLVDAADATPMTTYRRYRRYGLPAPFLRDFAVARTLRLAGAMALFGTVAAWLPGA